MKPSYYSANYCESHLHHEPLDDSGSVIVGIVTAHYSALKTDLVPDCLEVTESRVVTLEGGFIRARPATREEEWRLQDGYSRDRFNSPYPR